MLGVHPFLPKVSCKTCGREALLYGEVRPLGTEAGWRFFKCDGCGNITDEVLQPSRPQR